jgi:DNA-directed RNA polymerase specialized sigma24 family protein
MDDKEILLDLLTGDERQRAWQTFLGRFSNLLLKVIWHCEEDYDEVMEKYLFVCRKLAENDFARLRKFRIHDPESVLFTTWLASVTRNLCVDAHRSRFGRKQLPRAIARLSPLDREVFRLYYWKGYTLEELEHSVRNPEFRDSLERISEVLTGRTPEAPPFLLPLQENDLPPDDADADIDEMRGWLERWMDRLAEKERLIIRLRFWEDMTGPEIARTMNISSEQTVYPLLQKALSHLREQARQTYSTKIGSDSSVPQDRK